MISLQAFRASAYGRLLSHIVPYRGRFTTGVLATALLGATETLIPASMKPFLDGGFVERDPFYLVWAPLAIIGLFLVRAASSFVGQMAMSWVGSRVVFDLRQQMFERLLRLPISHFDHATAGSQVAKFTYNADNVATASTRAVTILVRDSLMVTGLLGYMLWVDWKLTLVTLGIVPVIAIAARKLSKRLRRLNHSLQDTFGEMTHILEESIRGIRVVKVFGGRQYEENRFQRAANHARQSLMKTVATSEVNVQASQVLAAGALALIIYVAADNAMKNELSLGAFMSFVVAMALVLSPLKRLAKINQELQRGLAAAEGIFELLDTATEPTEGTRELTGVRGAIRFEDVRFAYRGARDEALRGVSFSLEPGETLALVGPSGGGKSTVTHLIPRFYAQTAGAIYIDDVDTRELTLENLRSHIALIDQDVELFNDTIARNIAYGDHADVEEDRDAVVAAADDAHVTAFMERLADGLDTRIGEDGALLSGGQKQRLAIARAFFKDAPILILDEPTSALDSESEQQIQRNLSRLMEGRTTLIVAHRLSTIRNADRILVIDEGRIAESGTHHELMERKGLYHKLYESSKTAH